MSNERLSQEEINALLNDDPVEITPMEKDAMGEIGNIAFGSGATALSLLLNKRVKLTTPTVTITTMRQLIKEHPTPCVAAEVAYIKGLQGTNLLLLEIEDAAVIADLMQGGDGSAPKMELEEMEISAIGEAMNQMIGKASTSMSSLFNTRVEIAPPKTRILDLDEAEQIDEALSDNRKIAKISFRLEINKLVDSSLMLIIPLDLGREMAASLLKEEEKPEPAVTPGPDLHEEEGLQPLVGPVKSQEEEAIIQPVQFAPISPSQSPQEKSNLNLLLDVPLQISVELGSTRMRIKEILELGMGSIVELDRLAGEPVDVLVNGKIFARGEVVVIDENFGIKITDIVSPVARINNLQ
ncbi:MAG: flagellar motor switch phosphatase FliY [Firmicutes bacterium]|nr:flagellar motor switch phosphatase FliY [Bacillota bacterium]